MKCLAKNPNLAKARMRKMRIKTIACPKGVIMTTLLINRMRKKELRKLMKSN